MKYRLGLVIASLSLGAIGSPGFAADQTAKAGITNRSIGYVMTLRE
jgi:hypothetical protein